MAQETPKQRAERMAANAAAGVPDNVLAECPHWDARVADLTASTESHHVDYDWQPGDHGDLVLRRTVWTIAYRRKDLNIVWQGDVVTLRRNQVPAFVRDLVSCVST